MAKENGSWIPWEIAECLPPLRLRPASSSQVFLAVLVVWCRFGRTVAKLSIADIGTMTGLAPRTVKGSLTNLIDRGLLKRSGRYKGLVVDVKTLKMLAAPPAAGSRRTSKSRGRSGGADMRAPRKCTHVCTSPTSSHVSIKESMGQSVFTAKQIATIQDVMKQATELLGSDSAALELPTHFANRIGLAIGTTYGAAMREITATGTSAKAGTFTAAVLALRQDERVQGSSLDELASD
jgi:hypothetical protein